MNNVQDNKQENQPEQFEIIDLADSLDLLNGQASLHRLASDESLPPPDEGQAPGPKLQPPRPKVPTRSNQRAFTQSPPNLKSLGVMGRVNSDKPMFPISVAAEFLSVHTRTMRIYDDQGLVVPHRTGSNRLRYSPNDLKKVHFIQFLTQCRRVNLEGVKIILYMLDELRRYGSPDPIKNVFSDYQGAE